MSEDHRFGVGDRVRIIDRMPQEYAGKLGTITAMEDVRITAYPEAGVIPTPKITLDDGTVVYGFQVWWEKIGEDDERSSNPENHWRGHKGLSKG